jgi:sugar phosphate permease
LFNGVLVSWFFFMTQYLQGVSGFTPLQAGLAFLPVTGAAFAAASATSRLTRRAGNQAVAIAGCAAMLIGTVWMSRLSATAGYTLGIAVPMLVFGIGQGFGLSTLTSAGMAGVSPEDAGVAGGLVNVAHHLGGALGLGVLVTVFDTAGDGAHDARELLADRVGASFTAACVLLVLALAVTVIARPRRRATGSPAAQQLPGLAATVAPAHRAADTLHDIRACA